MVVQHHLPSDRNDSLASHLNNPPSLDVLTRELKAENNAEEKTIGELCLLPGTEDTVNDRAKETTETSDQDDQKLVGSEIEVMRRGKHQDSEIIRHSNDEATDKAGDQSNKGDSSISSLRERFVIIEADLT